MQEARDGERVAPGVERFVKQLVITYKAVTLYPPASSIPRENAAEAVAILGAILSDTPEMRLVATKEGLCAGETPVFPGKPVFTAFAHELYSRGVADVRFRVGVTADALTTFLGMLRYSQEELARSGGFAARLWEAGVDAITVSEAVTRIVDIDNTDDEPFFDEEWPPSKERLREMFAARTLSPRDRRVLLRALHDTSLLRRYLLETLEEHAGKEGEAERRAAIFNLSRAADAQPGDQRITALDSLSGTIISLPPLVLRELLISDMLHESRVNEPVAAVIRQLGLDEVCRAIVGEAIPDTVSLEGVARALRNLSFITLAARDDVLNAAGAAMRSAGYADGVIGHVLEMVAPSRLLVSEDPAADGKARPVETILHFMDHALMEARSANGDPALAALQEEARAGITDGDVTAALVSLAVLGIGTPEFDEALDALEVGLALLIQRGELVIAAETAEALLASVEGASEAERERLVAAVQHMAGGERTRIIYRALQVYHKDTPEHAASYRLLVMLGMSAIDSLLEMLADEIDMSVRKSLVDLISSVAATHIDELGKRVTDPRWYFVRNVVSILGGTRDPGIISYLSKTLRHADARVRRETIRALANLQGARSRELIMNALEDNDAQNVQLAARYLGTLRVRDAVPALIKVALGEGRGSRDHAPQAEAIEALGLIGDGTALPALESIIGRRRLIGAAKLKGLRTAARSAVTAIRAANDRTEESA